MYDSGIERKYEVNEEQRNISNTVAYFSYGFKALNIGYRCYKCASPIAIVKTIGTSLVQPTADFIAKKTQINAISTGAHLAIQGASLIVDPIGFVINKGIQEISPIISQKISTEFIARSNIQNLYAKAFIIASTEEFTQQTISKYSVKLKDIILDHSSQNNKGKNEQQIREDNEMERHIREERVAEEAAGAMKQRIAARKQMLQNNKGKNEQQVREDNEMERHIREERVAEEAAGAMKQRIAARKQMLQNNKGKNEQQVREDNEMERHIREERVAEEAASAMKQRIAARKQMLQNNKGKNEQQIREDNEMERHIREERVAEEAAGAMKQRIAARKQMLQNNKGKNEQQVREDNEMERHIREERVAEEAASAMKESIKAKKQEILKEISIGYENNNVIKLLLKFSNKIFIKTIELSLEENRKILEMADMENYQLYDEKILNLRRTIIKNYKKIIKSFIGIIVIDNYILRYNQNTNKENFCKEDMSSDIETIFKFCYKYPENIYNNILNFFEQKYYQDIKSTFLKEDLLFLNELIFNLIKKENDMAQEASKEVFNSITKDDIKSGVNRLIDLYQKRNYSEMAFLLESGLLGERAYVFGTAIHGLIKIERGHQDIIKDKMEKVDKLVRYIIENLKEQEQKVVDLSKLGKITNDKINEKMEQWMERLMNMAENKKISDDALKSFLKFIEFYCDRNEVPELYSIYLNNYSEIMKVISQAPLKIAEIECESYSQGMIRNATNKGVQSFSNAYSGFGLLHNKNNNQNETSLNKARIEEVVETNGQNDKNHDSSINNQSQKSSP